MKRKNVIRTITKQPIEVKSTAVHSALVKLEAICLLNNFKKAKKEKNKIVHFRGEKEAGSKSVVKFFLLISLNSAHFYSCKELNWALEVVCVFKRD